jgi:tyrosyl-tRNA synthetase
VPDPEHQLRLLCAGTVDVIRREELAARLRTGRPLRVKLGIDPTAADIHLGFAVVLRKLRQFQDLGHLAVLIIGDFTARVGDPTGRSATRPPLTAEQVARHAESYLAQVGRVLDLRAGRVEVLHNADWLGELDMGDVLRLTAQVTVARILERDDFAARMRSGTPIALSELLYPLLQGTDSVEVRADVELGGTDQLFNNLMGRHLQAQAGQEPQVVMTVPLLEGTDGVQKMSKSLGNAIGIAEPPAEQFGKLMSIPDAVLPRYLSLATGWDPDRARAAVEALAAGELHPAAAKRLLARTVVDLYHGPGAGEAAEAEFDRVFRAHEPPRDLPEVSLPVAELPMELPVLLVRAGLAASHREARRLVTQGGVRLDGRRLDDPEAHLDATDLDGRVLQRGRRRFVRVRVAPPGSGGGNGGASGDVVPVRSERDRSE